MHLQLVALTLLHLGLVLGNQSPKPSREKRVFSLFNIVQFRNEPCRSNVMTNSGSPRNGICFSTAECQNQGGNVMGLCAAGFGSCCVFTVSEGGRFSRNMTYLQNPGFPNFYPDNARVQYQLATLDDICTLRLNFETFQTVGTREGIRNDGIDRPCVDNFSFRVNGDSNTPPICGENSGQHIYLDVSGALNAEFTYEPMNAQTNQNVVWEIQVLQLACGDSNAPPSGCLQYHTSSQGRLTTFNFFGDALQTHLTDQSYSICIRANAGTCCVEYNVCNDEENAFSLANEDQLVTNSEMACDSDFIIIPGSSQECSVGPPVGLRSRYCGFFNNIAGTFTNTQICDCTPPFFLAVITNGGPETGVAMVRPRGLCLDYVQRQC